MALSAWPGCADRAEAKNGKAKPGAVADGSAAGGRGSTGRDPAAAPGVTKGNEGVEKLRQRPLSSVQDASKWLILGPTKNPRVPQKEFFNTLKPFSHSSGFASLAEKVELASRVNRAI